MTDTHPKDTTEKKEHTVNFDCRNCGHSLQSDMKNVGSTVHCPMCDAPNKVPLPRVKVGGGKGGKRPLSGKQTDAAHSMGQNSSDGSTPEPSKVAPDAANHAHASTHQHASGSEQQNASGGRHTTSARRAQFSTGAGAGVGHTKPHVETAASQKRVVRSIKLAALFFLGLTIAWVAFDALLPDSTATRVVAPPSPQPTVQEPEEAPNDTSTAPATTSPAQPPAAATAPVPSQPQRPAFDAQLTEDIIKSWMTIKLAEERIETEHKPFLMSAEKRGMEAAAIAFREAIAQRRREIQQAEEMLLSQLSQLYSSYSADAATVESAINDRIQRSSGNTGLIQFLTQLRTDLTEKSNGVSPDANTIRQLIDE